MFKRKIEYDKSTIIRTLRWNHKKAFAFSWADPFKAKLLALVDTHNRSSCNSLYRFYSIYEYLCDLE
jgi:hypothetical protein